VFPIIQVEERSATFFEFSKEDFYRVEVRERAPATESAGSGFDIAEAPLYYARVYAVHKDLDDITRASAFNWLNLERASTQWVTQQLMLQRERKWADSFFKAGVWSNQLTGVAGVPAGQQFKQWNDAAATPIEDITAQVITMAEMTGFRPNTLVLSPRVLHQLVNHPTILDRIRYTERGIISTDLLSTLFNVDRVVTPWGVINTAAKGATAAYSFIYGKHALLTYSSPTPDPLTPSAGYIFAWTGYAGAGAFGNRVSSFRIDERRVDRIEGELAYDMKVVSNSLGVFFNNAVA
jgi:hypothetical protein